MGQLHEIKKKKFYLHSQPYKYLPIKDGRLFNREVQSFPLKKPTKSGPFRQASLARMRERAAMTRGAEESSFPQPLARAFS